jgi:site-specific recombinase XerC
MKFELLPTVGETHRIVPLGGTVSDAILRAISAWLAEAARRSRHTGRAYRRVAEAFVAWAVEVLDGDDLSVLLRVLPTDVRAWLSTLDVADSTRAQSLAALRSMFRALVADGLRADNPAREITAPRGLGDRVEHTRAITVQEVCRGLSGLPDTMAGRRDRAVILLALNSGLRRGEVAGLDRGDVDLASDEPCLVIHGKGGKIVRAPLGASTAAAISKWLEVAAFPEGEDGPLFAALTRNPRLRGARLSGEAINQIIKRRFGMSWTAHCLRARGITDTYLRSGSNASIAQAFARHSNPATTQIYLDIERIRDAARYAPDYA